MYPNETYIYSSFYLYSKHSTNTHNIIKKKTQEFAIKIYYIYIYQQNLSILICGRLLECTARKKSKSLIRSLEILIQISELQLQLLNYIILEIV